MCLSMATPQSSAATGEAHHPVRTAMNRYHQQIAPALAQEQQSTAQQMQYLQGAMYQAQNRYGELTQQAAQNIGLAQQYAQNHAMPQQPPAPASAGTMLPSRYPYLYG